MDQNLSHFDEQGQAVMVDIQHKENTARVAIAQGQITVNKAVISAVLAGRADKGDVLNVARIAGIMATKRTADLIPLCHPLILSKCTLDFEIIEKNSSILASCTVKTDGKTGVEMEALTGCTVALLTIYDMCKAIDKRMVIGNVHLQHKSGGKSGLFEFGGLVDA